MKELCWICAAAKSHITPYHLAGNGLYKRFNQTLLNLLGTLETDKKVSWTQYIGELVHVYNNTVHASTGFTPFFLMFGSHARLPVDLVMGTEAPAADCTMDGWVSQHHENKAYAYQKTGKHMQEATQCQKTDYDRTAQETPLLPGERMLLRRRGARGRGKLSDK